jgi:outer membrane protein assembly factor BamB
MQALCLLLLAVGFSGSTSAQTAAPETEAHSHIMLAGDSPGTASQIAAADKLVSEHKWSDAIDTFQRILREGGDDLVSLDGRHSIQARRLCHLRIAALPGEALSLYRSRVDRQAKEWLDEAIAAADRGLLRRLVDEMFASSYTGRAIDMLGDLAFERGEFDEALRWWSMLTPPAPSRCASLPKDHLAWPGPWADLALSHAKRILALLFQADWQQAGKELERFQKEHGDANGRLAGRNGKYLHILTEIATKREVPASHPVESWRTFAGDTTRNLIQATAEGALNRLPMLRGPQWVVDVQTGLRQRRTSGRLEIPPLTLNAHRDSPKLCFYPIIVEKQAVVADGRYVRSFDLQTGRQSWQYDLKSDVSHLEVSRRTPVESSPTYTLTATDDAVFARLGVQGIDTAKSSPDKGTHPDSFLVCLDLFPDRPDSLRKWIIPPPAPAGAYAVFEGSPLVYNNRVYIAVTRFAGVDEHASIACYDAESKLLLWHTDLCSTEQTKEHDVSLSHRLLTLAGSQIVFCSHSGAIAAVDAANGRHTWSMRYPSRGRNSSGGSSRHRGVSPCMHRSGRLYVAPLDLDRILCFDADTGHLVWESTLVEVVHLLGVANERLIFTAMTPHTLVPQHSIRALDTTTGRVLANWYQPADGNGELATFGRGLLAGGRVYWPTAAGLYVLDQETAEVIAYDPAIRGNLAAANGCLVVAGPEQMAAYVAERLLR